MELNPIGSHQEKLLRIRNELKARAMVEGLFANLKARTGIALSVQFNFKATLNLRVFEATGKQWFESWPTKRFVNQFSSNVEMANYFERALATYMTPALS